ncbi:hypothetical protein BsWGS_00039 [Bradybaena similaris]
MARPELRPLLLWLLCVPGLCWDSGDLELFDLMEEIDDNFYHVFDIDQSASSSDVRKAYRRLSLQYHPDKNQAENAEEQFRQIVAIYEVLKDEKKRERYNQVLIEGLPNWRQPVYYYRHARKMGIFELGIVLSMIITVGQYFVAWAVYVEKRLVLEEVINSKKKKEKKKRKQTMADDAVNDDDELNSIPTPHVLDLWPFRLSAFIFHTVRGAPEAIKHWQEERKRRKEEEEAQALEEEQEDSEEFVRKPKKRVATELPEYTSEMYAKFSAPTDSRKSGQVSDLEVKEAASQKKGEWSDEELVLLSRAVNRFPGGCHQRWEKIADMVGRSVSEVVAKTKETKGNYSMQLSTSVQSSSFNSKLHGAGVLINDDIITHNSPDVNYEMPDDTSDNTCVRKRQNKTAERTVLISQGDTQRSAMGSAKTKVITVHKDNGTAVAAVDDSAKCKKEAWTQNQQTIFEWALKQYPKGTDQRWEKIAEQIPGKTKEDCITRFKMLAELVSKRKKTEVQDITAS